MTEYQAMNMELLHIFVSQQQICRMMIEAEWEGMQQMNSPRDIFTRFQHYFQFNVEKISFL